MCLWKMSKMPNLLLYWAVAAIGFLFSRTFELMSHDDALMRFFISRVVVVPHQSTSTDFHWSKMSRALNSKKSTVYFILFCSSDSKIMLEGVNVLSYCAFKKWRIQHFGTREKLIEQFSFPIADKIPSIH